MRVPAGDYAVRAGHFRRLALAVALAASCGIGATAMWIGTRLRRGLDMRAGATILLAASATAFAAATFIPERDPVSVHASPPAEAPPGAPPAPLPPAEIRLALAMPAASENWTNVRRPIAMFHIEGSETDGLELRTQVATRGRGARRDLFLWTARPEGKPPARSAIAVVIERYETGMPTFRPFYPDQAMRVAEEGFSIERMSAPGEIATKFGAFEVADAHLAGDRGRLACLIFRRADMIGLTITGWFCGSPERPADRVGLACFLNRLDLVGAGKDQALKRHFAAAERNRKGCVSQRMAGRKPPWYEHEAPLPALKLTQRGR